MNRPKGYNVKPNGSPPVLFFPKQLLDQMTDYDTVYWNVKYFRNLVEILCKYFDFPYSLAFNWQTSLWGKYMNVLSVDICIYIIPCEIPSKPIQRLGYVCPKQKDAKIFEKHLNPVTLVFIGYLTLSTLRWVPICTGFSVIFEFFLHHFVLADLATTSTRVKGYVPMYIAVGSITMVDGNTIG